MSAPEHLTVTIRRSVALDVLWDIEAMNGRGEQVSPSMTELGAALQELVGYDEYHGHTGRPVEPL